MIGILRVYLGKELFVFVCKIMQQIHHIRYPTTKYFHFDYHSSNSSSSSSSRPHILYIIMFALLICYGHCYGVYKVENGLCTVVLYIISSCWKWMMKWDLWIRTESNQTIRNQTNSNHNSFNRNDTFRFSIWWHLIKYTPAFISTACCVICANTF